MFNHSGYFYIEKMLLKKSNQMMKIRLLSNSDIETQNIEMKTKA